MILHSIVSASDIFYNEADVPHKPEYRRVEGGVVELDGNRIRRLISTDPKLYLNSKYFPSTEFRG